MLRRIGAVSLLSAGALGAPSAAACNIDLVEHGMPSCAQACQAWCWATVIGEFEEYYRASPLLGSSVGERPGVTPQCRQQECSVVSSVRGIDCCHPDPNPSGCMTGEDPCGLGGMPAQIVDELQKRIPHAGKWQHDAFIPAESKVQELLMAGHPIGRLVPGHIDAIVGCRPGKNGTTEYRAIDSLLDPNANMWFDSFNELMDTPWAPDSHVRGVIYAELGLPAVVVV